MATYTKSSPSYNGRYYKITLTQDTYDSAAGTVNVNWTFECLGGSSNFYSAPATSITAYNPNDGTTTTIYSHAKTMYSGGNTAPFPVSKGSRSGTKTFSTASDGTLTLTIRFKKDSMSFSGATWSSCDYSETWTLDQIPRASTISLSTSTQTLGNNINIVVTKKSNSFTHVISILDGSTVVESFPDTTTNATYTKAWTPTVATYQSRIVLSKTFVVSCQTYKNATQTNENKVGSPATANVTLNFPSSGYEPTCTISKTLDQSAFPTASGKAWEKVSSGIVKGKTKLSITTTFGSSYGASLSSISVSYDGNSGSSTSSPYTWSNVACNNSGSKTISATVKDNRNRTKTSTDTFTVVNYFNPTCSVTATRNGNTLNVNYTYSIAPVNYNNKNQNYKSFVIKYKKTSDSSYTNLVNNTSDYSKSNQTATASLAETSSYNIQVVITDSCTSYTYNYQVGTAFDLMNFNSSGNAMAIGKISEATGSNKLFEVGIPTTFSDNVTVSSGKTISGSLSGNATTATTATKLGSSTVGSATKPIYLNGGTPTAGTQLADAAYRGVKTRSTTGDLGWGTNNTYVPDMAMLAYWNGRYNGSSSNLTYCSGGTIANTSQLPTLTNGTITFTKSSGNGNMLYGHWWCWGGKVVYLEIAFKTNGGSTSVGSNIWSGKISGVPALPYYRATGVGYYSGSHYIAGLYGQKKYDTGQASSDAGRLDIRALGQNAASNSDAHSLSITYIIP